MVTWPMTSRDPEPILSVPNISETLVTMPLSPALFEILACKCIGVTTLTFQGHVTIWSHVPISYRRSIATKWRWRYVTLNVNVVTPICLLSIFSKIAGDRGFVPKGSPIGIGNVLWRVEWSLARWRHVSGLLIRNWLHIVTPLSESIKFAWNYRTRKLCYSKDALYK